MPISRLRSRFLQVYRNTAKTELSDVMKFQLLLVCGLTLFFRITKGTRNDDEIDLTDVQIKQETEEFDANAIKAMLSRLKKLEAQSEQQANEVRSMRGENKRHQQDSDRQAKTIDRLVKEIEQQTQKMNEILKNDVHQSDVLGRQQQLMQTMQTKLGQYIDASVMAKGTSKKGTPEPDTRSQFTAFTCTTANISLSCPANRSILVTTGNYGQHGLACSKPCCSPNPQYDCTEVIEENSPQDWLAIQALCDGQESCAFPNLGTTISDCEVGYLSDYMQLFYDCLLDDETGPVAFTAGANTGNPTEYISGDVVVFDEVLANFGGHYNPATSSFICPIDGVYLLSVSVMTTLSDAFVDILMRNGITLARAYGDNISNVHNHVGTTIVTECNRSEALWVRAGSTSTLYGAAQYSVFTGHLIQAL